MITPDLLIPYASQHRPTDDTSLVGGAIDTTVRVTFNDTPTSGDLIEIVSDNSADTSQLVTVTVMGTNGVLREEQRLLEGLEPVDFNSIGPFDRIESVIMDSSALGNVTVRVAVNHFFIAVIPPGERGFTRMFLGSLPSPDFDKVYYEKFFWKNISNSEDLVNPLVSISANPSDSISHCLATAVNDSFTTINRLTEPGFGALSPPYVFDTVARDTPNSRINAGQAIGVWVAMSLRQSSPPVRSSFSTKLTGASI